MVNRSVRRIYKDRLHTAGPAAPLRNGKVTREIRPLGGGLADLRTVHSVRWPLHLRHRGLSRKWLTRRKIFKPGLRRQGARRKNKNGDSNHLGCIKITTLIQHRAS